MPAPPQPISGCGGAFFAAAAFEFFQQTEWNYYRYPDPMDKPSPLFDQLLWLKAAGFAVVDCFWLQAGHAIYGGYKADS